MTFGKVSRIGLLMSVSWCASTASSALAQATDATQARNADVEADGRPDVIIVTARKRDESLLEVPESITALQSGTIERAGVTELEDIGKLAPNLNLNRRQDNSPNVTIRGVGAFGRTQGVGFYIDGVQNFDDPTSRLADVELIEVLKGPQGTLYGGNNIGGAVKISTRRPEFSWSGRAEITLGEQDTLNILGAITGPLTDNVAFRLSAFRDEDDGFLTNTTLDRPGDAKEEFGTRLQVLAEPGDSTEIYLTARYNNLDSTADIAYYLTDRPDAYSRTIESGTPGGLNRDVYQLTAEISHDFGGVTLTSVSNFQQVKDDVQRDADFSSLPLFFLYGNTNFKTLSQELRLTSPSGGDFEWLVGAYGLRRTRDFDALIDIIGVPVAVPFGPFRLTNEQVAGFGLATYRPMEKLEIAVGARVNYWRGAATDRNPFLLPVLPAAALSDSIDGTEFLPKATVTYFWSDNLMTYAQVAKGFEPGGAGAPSQTQFVGVNTYGPERTWNYELGLKGSALDGALSFSAAAFYIDYDARQFEDNFSIPETGAIASIIQNVGDSFQYGGEIEVSYRPTRQLTLSASAAVLEAKWDNLVFGGEDLQELGDPRPFNSPEYSAAFAIDFTQPVIDEWDAFFRADLSLNGRDYWDIRNLASQDPYQIVGLAAGIGNGTLKLTVRAENLFDEDYNTEYYPSFFPLNPPEIQDAAARGQPRRITATLAAAF